MMRLQQELERLLDELARSDGILGAAVISRDGLPVKAAGRPEMHRETFSAMAATLVGAAEIALSEFDASKTRSVVASTDRARMVLVGASRDLLLAVMADVEAPMGPLVARVEEAARAVSNALGG